MSLECPDDLVPFLDVRVMRSTAPALLCQIAGRDVWLPRAHIRGKLWCTGDRGKLFIRRWVALDRHLVGPGVAMVGPSPVPPPSPSPSPRHLPVRLRIVPRHTPHAS